MLVFVQNKDGRPLMPCSAAKARFMLKEKKASIVSRTPFTIKLLYGSSGYKQAVNLGVDSGFQHIGISAISEKKELFATEVVLRSDMVNLNSERLSYRRNRRTRKTWYRKPRFLNRVSTKKPGWFAPSIRNKIETHLKVVDKVVRLLPISSIKVEVANFDIQKIRNPNISGEMYQQGEQSGFWNIREYVLYRDGHKCCACGGKSNDQILNVHHIESRKTGGDRPENLITLCESCHKNFHAGIVKFKFNQSESFKSETFMTSVRWEIINKLKETYNDIVSFTYGYKTKQKRIANFLPKSHINDAFVIASGTNQLRSSCYLIKQVRKCNRKLFKGDRSHLRNTAPRFIKNFQRFDKVFFKGIECFIFGRRSTGYFDLRKLDGTKIHASASVKFLKLKESFKTLLIERIDSDAVASVLAEGHPLSSRP
ncbi:MAG: HNH endonuclease [Oligoflexia bacterium]|nr:HNH endonuclease [Oligoflexia bacterium]